MKKQILVALSVPVGIVCGLFFTLIQFHNFEINPEKSNLIPELGQNAIIGSIAGAVVSLVIYLTRKITTAK
jgi:uncharacterized membrane protein YvlD (DUF360 family)